ncbi:MAG: replication-associated recombination protein A [Alphaproteobacteria bacterium]|nr:replication-associated recombination protein A [Alphaproteobacteria bacterium]
MSGTGSLFNEGKGTHQPLAERLRPQTLEDVVGQDHLVGPQGLLTRLLSQPTEFPSLIFWGPPGCGKTTLARLLAQETNLFFVAISAIFTGTQDLKAIFEQAQSRLRVGQRTLLFVDEIHRFNRTQQDTFLAHLEDGRLTLVGATTENPSFELNSALLSRCQVLTLKRLDEKALSQLFEKACTYLGQTPPLTDDARHLLFQLCDGDGRTLLNFMAQLDALSFTTGTPLDTDMLLTHLPRRAALYDKGRDGHYSLISALHKAVRGSDVNAALYWFARMLEGGESPLYIGRRLVRMASEDVGLADPNALLQAVSALEVYERLGSPEGELALAGALVYLASAPKSNALYVAYKRARAAAKENGSLPPPSFAINAATKWMEGEGFGQGYEYDHDAPDAFSGQNYFPDGMSRQGYYDPPDRGFEREIRKRLEFWRQKRSEREAAQHEVSKNTR